METPGQDNELIGLALTEIVDAAFYQHRLWRGSSNLEDYLDFLAQLKTRINLTVNQPSI